MKRREGEGEREREREIIRTRREVKQMERCLLLFSPKKQETVEFHLQSCYQPIKTILQYLKEARSREEVLV
jgi:hypothetical protein